MPLEKIGVREGCLRSRGTPFSSLIIVYFVMQGEITMLWKIPPLDQFIFDTTVFSYMIFKKKKRRILGANGERYVKRE